MTYEMYGGEISKLLKTKYKPNKKNNSCQKKLYKIKVIRLQPINNGKY